MSGPTWLPPRTLGSPERPAPPMSHAGAAIYALPNKKPSSSSDPRPKYSAYDQNGGGGGGRGGATRYMATGPTGGPVTHPSNEHYYRGHQDERTWSPHMDSYELMRRGPEKPGGLLHHHSNIDAEIDSLTSMLADLDSSPQDNSTQLYDNVPCVAHLPGERFKPSAQSRAPSVGRPSAGGYPPHPHPHPQSHPHPHSHSQYHPAPPYPNDHQAPQYTNQPPHHQDYSYTTSSTPKPYPQPDHASYTSSAPKPYPQPDSASYSSTPKPYPQPVPASYDSAPKPYPQPVPASYDSAPKPYPQPVPASYDSAPKPYPQPVPASYTTSSTPTGPRFSVQVKTAQPVTYSQSGRQAEQAYTPPPPRQHPAARPLPPQTTAPPPQGWHHPAAPQAQDGHSEGGYKGGSAPGSGGRAGGQGAGNKRGPETSQSGAGSAHQPGKQGAAPRPEEELDRLTKKLVYDMNHPPAEEYFGRCARCLDNVLGDGSGCIAMEQVFHVECFTCITCHARLRGQPFYALDKKSYCESCYISTLERCSKCSQPILDRILRAMGKAYHPRCFSCVVCGVCLDGVPFTVDATSQIHCIEDFHRKFAPRCSVCAQAIMPEPGQEETVRIVALDRSFHVNCYVCEECGLLLSSEGEGRGCYPLDGHILCKSCSARRIQDLSAKISTDC